MKIISFLNNKGGVLKTTLVVNIAGALATKGKKVLILDTDPQGSVLGRFGRNSNDEKHNLIDLFKKTSKMEQAVKYVWNKNIAVISSDFSLSMLEVDIANKTISSQYINKIFNKIKTIASQEFDYLLIDCAPTFGRLTNEVIKLTDEIIVPSSMEQDSFKGIINLINILKSLNSIDKLKWVIPTLFKSRTNLHTTLLSQWIKPLSKQEGFKVSKNPIKESVRASTINIQHKVPITLTNSKLQAKTVYFDLIKEMWMN